MSRQQSSTGSPTPHARSKRQSESWLPLPLDQEDREGPLWEQMTSSFDWYDRAATRNRLGYQCLRLAALVAGAVITVLAAIDAPPAITASLAACVVVLEGIQQLFQFHTNWISYRTTAESLRAEALLYAANLFPYDDPTTRRHRLGRYLSETRTSETTTWASAMKETAAPKNRDSR